MPSGTVQWKTSPDPQLGDCRLKHAGIKDYNEKSETSQRML